MMSVSSWVRDRSTNRGRDSRSKAIALVTILFQKAGTTVVCIAGIVGLIYVSFQAGAPGPDDSAGSGIIVRVEVIALWIPRALHDMAQLQDGAPVFLSPEAVHTELKRRGLNDAWYALTYRGHQVNREFVDMTQIRRLSAAADHLDELQAVMAKAAGRPPQYDGLDFSLARVEVIPDTLQAVDPREAVTRLIDEPVVGNKRSPTEGTQTLGDPDTVQEESRWEESREPGIQTPFGMIPRDRPSPRRSAS
jgi:hypothetical protein